jgi:hypothetical protein
MSHKMIILGVLNEKKRGIVAPKVASMIMHVICKVIDSV